MSWSHWALMNQLFDASRGKKMWLKWELTESPERLQSITIPTSSWHNLSVLPIWWFQTYLLPFLFRLLRDDNPLDFPIFWSSKRHQIWGLKSPTPWVSQVHPSGGVGKQPLSLNFQCRHVRRMLSINSGGRGAERGKLLLQRFQPLNSAESLGRLGMSLNQHIKAAKCL